MFSKEESARLRKEFWTSYGKSFPRKWMLYNTKIKDLSLKFHADRKKAAVMIDNTIKYKFNLKNNLSLLKRVNEHKTQNNFRKFNEYVRVTQ